MHHLRKQHGIALLMTLVLLMVLSFIGYLMATTVAARRHRMQYLMDYQAARYACDSGLKYAMAALQQIDPQLIERPNEPDFSDVFAMDEVAYRRMKEEYAMWLYGEDYQNPQMTLEQSDFEQDVWIDDDFDENDINDFNDINDPNRPRRRQKSSDQTSLTQSMQVEIPGPYGPRWPLIQEPAEVEIGSATVTIRIEDENAKYPIGWAIMEDEQIQRELQAGFTLFCEWMDINDVELDQFYEQLYVIADNKPFQKEFKNFVTTEQREIKDKRGRRLSRRKRTVKTKVSADVHLYDFSKLFHSSIIDAEFLTRPKYESGERDESALKYISLWPIRKVNINTAPRHVLEAAFMFGGYSQNIAEAIIQRRRVKPFESIEELRTELYGYASAIERCQDFIVTESTDFSIRITAVSGTAKASAVIGAVKRGEKFKRIGVITDRL